MKTDACLQADRRPYRELAILIGARHGFFHFCFFCAQNAVESRAALDVQRRFRFLNGHLRDACIRVLRCPSAYHSFQTQI